MRSSKYMLIPTLLGVLFMNSFAEASDRVINKIVWLGTTSQIEFGVDEALIAAANIPLHYFSIDEGSNILRHFERSFPARLYNASEDTKNAYLQKNLAPKLKAYAPELMRSQLGVSLAKLYRIERIPAVIINDKYITYGLNVSESIAAFHGNPSKQK